MIDGGYSGGGIKMIYKKDLNQLGGQMDLGIKGNLKEKINMNKDRRLRVMEALM